jgi:hypothetical protein
MRGHQHGASAAHRRQRRDCPSPVPPEDIPSFPGDLPATASGDSDLPHGASAGLPEPTPGISPVPPRRVRRRGPH